MRPSSFIALLAAVSCALAACTPQQIYDGAYLWGDNGWDATIVKQDSTHQFNGKPSVCWTASNYQGIYFKYAGTLTASTFGSLVFAVNGYSGGQNQRVEFYYNGNIIGNQLLIATYTGGSVPTSWTQVSIPINDFGLAASQLIDGVVFQANTAGTTLQNLLCYNNVSLQCNPGGAPSATTPPPVSYAGSGNSPKGPYTVSGNQILDSTGAQHIFRGWARPSLEWSAVGEGFTDADMQNIANTGANVVRLSLNQNFWISGGPQYVAGYRATIQGLVTLAKTKGMSVILDLHWSNKGSLSNTAMQQNMADSYSIQFWQEVAAAYKDDPEVLFELYNEPHDVTCSAWRDGGTGAWGFTVAGMQQLYDAVRGTGATNLVIVGGLDYAYDLTCVKTYPLTGTGIVYNTHPYFNFNPKGTPADWDTYFGFLLADHPVMATEFGNFDCSTAAYVTWLDYTTTKKVHWTAWAWYPQGCGFPSLITDWSASLTAPGQLVANALYANRPNATPTATTTATNAQATTTAVASTSASAVASAASTTAVVSVTAAGGSAAAASTAGTTAAASASTTLSVTAAAATTGRSAAAAHAASLFVVVAVMFVQIILAF